MTGIDLTCLSKDEILNENIVSGIGTWISEILDYIIQEKRQKEYVLLVDFYAEKFLNRRFPGFTTYSIGGVFSKSILMMTNKSSERYLKKYGFASRMINNITNIETIWFPFGIPEIVYWGNKKTIITLHDFMKCNTEDEIKSYRKMIDKTDFVVVISEFVGNELKRLFPEFSNKVIATIPNSICVNLDDMKAVDSIASKFILDINRYEKHKNAHTLLKAFKRLVYDYSCDSDLVFVGFGDESYLNELKSYAQDNGISDKVHFFWKLAASEKNWLLKNATVFVSPSVNEGMGRTPIEAMICGIPTLTTKETSLYEATLGLANYCEDPYDDFEMACKINQLLIESISEDEKKSVSSKLKNKYSAENIWLKYTRVFDEESKR